MVGLTCRTTANARHAAVMAICGLAPIAHYHVAKGAYQTSAAIVGDAQRQITSSTTAISTGRSALNAIVCCRFLAAARAECPALGMA